MSGQARARARQNQRMGRLEGRPLTDHKEAKVDHWTIQETGRYAWWPRAGESERSNSPGY